jgi:hypothetical protein
VENVILVIVILLPVKYLLKLSGSRNFYRFRMMSLTSTNVFTISCLSIEPKHPSLYCTIRGLFDYSHYSSTIRGLFALFVDYSRTIRTIRRLFALFVDYSHYSSTIRTIRFTILVLSITVLKRDCDKRKTRFTRKHSLRVETQTHRTRFDNATRFFS